MARQSKKAGATRVSRDKRPKRGAIRTKSVRSAYVARQKVAPDPVIAGHIDEWIRYGETLRSEIERRIDARLPAR